MDKISNAQIAEVLTDAATTLRAKQAHIEELEEQLSAHSRRGRVAKLASEMQRKGIETDASDEALYARLDKLAEAGKLDVFEQAVELTGPDMGTKLAQLANDGPGMSSGSSDLERFLVGDVG